MNRICRVLAVAGLVAGMTSTVWSFDLSPKGTRFDRDAVSAWAPSWLDNILTWVADKGLPKFKESVHEEATHRAYGCIYEGPAICGNPDAQFATPYVIAGVRWNDDPPFQMNSNQAKGTSCKIAYKDGRPVTIRFITQPQCWAELFLAAEKQIKADANTKFDVASQAALPLRSHFGDLQFIHSMASSDGEDATETRSKILGWAELTWGVVRGSYKLETWLKDIDVPVAQQFFGKSGWRIQELFTLGDPSMRAYVSDVAFGSLLHMVEDSFAAGHVDRMEPANGAQCPGNSHDAPGPIREFHSYIHQTTSTHAGADSRDAFINNNLPPGVVDVGRTLVKMRKGDADWPAVKAYLLCVYDLAPGVRNASAGGF